MEIKPTCSCKGRRSCLLCEKAEGGRKRICPSPESMVYFYNATEATAEPAEKGEGLTEFLFPGVLVYRDFITEREELGLIQSIESSPWKPSQSGRYKQDYGPKVNFKKRKLKLGSFTGLPLYMRPFVERLNSLGNLQDFQTVELCNLEYCPIRGSAIDPHFDDNWLWGERLVTLNLASSTWLTMTWGGNEEQTIVGMHRGTNSSSLDPSKLIVKLPLERRSLIVLYGPARYFWKHSIRREDIKCRRICCTFRELSKEFLMGDKKDDGQRLLNIANSFCGSVVL